MFTTMLIESDMKRYLKLQGKKAGPPEKEQHYPWTTGTVQEGDSNPISTFNANTFCGDSSTFDLPIDYVAWSKLFIYDAGFGLLIFC